jgi:hypothetical protein
MEIVSGIEVVVVRYERGGGIFPVGRRLSLPSLHDAEGPLDPDAERMFRFCSVHLLAAADLFPDFEKDYERGEIAICVGCNAQGHSGPTFRVTPSEPMAFWLYVLATGKGVCKSSMTVEAVDGDARVHMLPRE